MTPRPWYNAGEIPRRGCIVCGDVLPLDADEGLCARTVCHRLYNGFREQSAVEKKRSRWRNAKKAQRQRERDAITAPGHPPAYVRAAREADEIVELCGDGCGMRVLQLEEWADLEPWILRLFAEDRARFAQMNPGHGGSSRRRARKKARGDGDDYQRHFGET